MYLYQRQSGAVFRCARTPLPPRPPLFPYTTLFRSGELASGGGRYPGCVRVPRCGESAERSDAAVVRRELGSPRVLGREPVRMGARWHGGPALDGSATGDGAVGTAGGAGGAGGGRRA